MKFLASVGIGQLFRIEDGQPRLVATARTLTDTSFSFSSQSTDVTTGAGDQLADTFTGQSRLKIDLTEVNFDLNYLGAILNPNSVVDPAAFFSEPEMLIVDQNRSVTLTKTPAPLGHSFGLNKYLIFYKKSAAPESQWQYVVVSDNGKTVALPSSSAQVGDKVCVKYFISVPQARSTLIGANFFPQELTLILTMINYLKSANTLFHTYFLTHFY